MDRELHPFWRGVQDEFQKQGFVEGIAEALPAVGQFLMTPAGLATLGVAAGGGLALGALRRARLAKAAPAAADAAKKGFGWKGLAAAAGAGALGTAYLMGKKKSEG